MSLRKCFGWSLDSFQIRTADLAYDQQNGNGLTKSVPLNHESLLPSGIVIRDNLFSYTDYERSGQRNVLDGYDYLG